VINETAADDKIPSITVLHCNNEISLSFVKNNISMKRKASTFALFAVASFSKLLDIQAAMDSSQHKAHDEVYRTIHFVRSLLRAGVLPTTGPNAENFYVGAMH